MLYDDEVGKETMVLHKAVEGRGGDDFEAQRVMKKENRGEMQSP